MSLKPILFIIIISLFNEEKYFKEQLDSFK